MRFSHAALAAELHDSCPGRHALSSSLHALSGLNWQQSHLWGVTLQADLVLVLDGGRITARGTHAQLAAQGVDFHAFEEAPAAETSEPNGERS